MIALSLPLLIALGPALPSPCVADGTILVHVNVTHCGCEAPKTCNRNSYLRVSAKGVDESGWPVTVYPTEVKRSKSKPAWRTFKVPSGTEVGLSVFAPPHPLVEQSFRLPGEGNEKRVSLELPAPVPEVKLALDVEMPEEAPTWADGCSVRFLSPQTGSPVMLASIREVRTGVHLPRGTYDIEVRGELVGVCGNGRPSPQAFVPASARWYGDTGERIVLRPQNGARLKLHVVHPGAGSSASTMKPLNSSSDDGTIRIGMPYDGDAKDLVRVRLRDPKGGKHYDLTWGWKGLAYVFPWDRFPMGQDVYQIVPVPFGEYELILRGRGLEELRRMVILGPGGPTKLRLKPRLSSED